MLILQNQKMLLNKIQRRLTAVLYIIVYDFLVNPGKQSTSTYPDIILSYHNLYSAVFKHYIIAIMMVNW